MTRDGQVEAVAKAIYEADDPWSNAWPWPNPKDGHQDKIRDIARAAIAAYEATLERKCWLIEHGEHFEDISWQPLTDADKRAGYRSTPLFAIPDIKREEGGCQGAQDAGV